MLQHYYKLFKPYGMLSQFTPESGHPALGSLYPFPKDVYPLGRLDHDSEGLLLLTSDKAVNALLLGPDGKHQRTYWAQVEGIPGEEAFLQLRKGVLINLKGIVHKTFPAIVKTMVAPKIAERDPPVNYKKHPVISWIEITLKEGKNRQVRKMLAKAGHPVLRLIRSAVDEVTIEGMQAGEVVELERKEFYTRLNLPW